MLASIGDMRERITILAAEDERGNYGKATPVFKPLTLEPEWAEVVMLAGRELERAQQTDGSIDCRVRMRWRPGVTEKMRVRWENELDADQQPVELDIIAVTADPKRIQLELMCSTV
jgi:SPP1 family predicted phage head-tail adaptor